MQPETGQIVELLLVYRPFPLYCFSLLLATTYYYLLLFTATYYYYYYYYSLLVNYKTLRVIT